MPRIIFAVLAAALLLAPAARAQVTIENTTQGTTHATLQEAIDAANNGDAIALGPGVLEEENVVFRSGIDVHVSGAGRDATIIDPGDADRGGQPILNFNGVAVTNNTVISDLTLRNGMRRGGMFRGGGAAFLVDSASPTFLNVDFIGNEAGSNGSGGSHVAIDDVRGTPVVFINCRFSDGRVAFAPFSARRSDVRLINCLIVRGQETVGLVFIMGNYEMVNCSVPRGAFDLRESNDPVSLNLVNSAVFSPDFSEEASVTAHRSFFPGATGDNIDGQPSFLQSTFALAPGSPGIDAGSLALYLAESGLSTAKDALGNDRLVDDPLAPNIIDDFAIDIGAVEAAPPPTCPSDFASPSDVFDIFDVIEFLNRAETCP